MSLKIDSRTQTLVVKTKPNKLSVKPTQVEVASAGVVGPPGPRGAVGPHGGGAWELITINEITEPVTEIVFTDLPFGSYPQLRLKFVDLENNTSEDDSPALYLACQVSADNGVSWYGEGDGKKYRSIIQQLSHVGVNHISDDDDVCRLTQYWGGIITGLSYYPDTEPHCPLQGELDLFPGGLINQQLGRPHFRFNILGNRQNANNMIHWYGWAQTMTDIDAYFAYNAIRFFTQFDSSYGFKAGKMILYGLKV